MSKSLPILGTIFLLGTQLALAEPSPKIDRAVGSDGVPTLTIRGEAPKQSQSRPARAPKTPDFQFYDLQTPDETAWPEKAPKDRSRPEVIVVGSPPPIAPNPAAWAPNWGWDWGYDPFFGYPPVGPIGPGWNHRGHHHRGHHGGHFHRGHQRGAYLPPLIGPIPPVNYQNPPVNYQNPPVNYQNRVPGGFYRVR